MGLLVIKEFRIGYTANNSNLEWKIKCSFTKQLYIELGLQLRAYCPNKYTTYAISYCNPFMWCARVLKVGLGLSSNTQPPVLTQWTNLVQNCPKIIVSYFLLNLWHSLKILWSKNHNKSCFLHFLKWWNVSHILVPLICILKSDFEVATWALYMVATTKIFSWQAPIFFFSDLPYETQFFLRLPSWKKSGLILSYFFRVAKAPIFSKLKMGCRLKGQYWKLMI